MTKLERAAEKARKEKEKLAEQERLARESRAAQRKTIMQAEASVRAETRKATNKRRYHIGAMADEAGLLAWSETDLQKVFLAVARLRETPNPGAVLESLLLDIVPGAGCVPSAGLATRNP
jgi:hypothetical protein